MAHPNSLPIVEAIRRIWIEDAHYAVEAVQENYAFADYQRDQPVLGRVALAAFSESPPSARSACAAMDFVPTGMASAARIEALTALGAPRVILLRDNEAEIWQLRRSEAPARERVVAANCLPEVIRTEAALWSPDAIRRTSGLAPVGVWQSDFSDLGLWPVIEREVHIKLDRLLREVLFEATEQASRLKDRRHFPRLIRAVFGLLTAKVLIDRRHPEALGPTGSGAEALALAQTHLGQTSEQWVPPAVLATAWDRIRSGFLFHNVSIDALTHLYEHTLVTPENRDRLGIHATPRGVAELMASLLPLESLPENRQRVVELCAGYGPFLLAALKRLQAQIGGDPNERHRRLVTRLHGVEIEPFAIEVCRLSLTLADYPHRDGWRLEQDDVFRPGRIVAALEGAGAVFSNPPFEKFSAIERERYQAGPTTKAVELLRRLLEVEPPPLLGLVLPRVVVESRSGPMRALHEQLRRRYREIDTILAPDNLFTHSNVETVLLVARRPEAGERVTLRSANVPGDQAAELQVGHYQPTWREEEQALGGGSLLVDPLADVWGRLSTRQRLGEVATIHRGIQYNQPKEAVLARLSDQGTHRAKGVALAEALHPFGPIDVVDLVTDPNALSRAGRHGWSRPKVLVNAIRRSRDPWCLTAAVDDLGLWGYQAVQGVWPNDPHLWSIEVLAAVLNGPIAAARLRGHKHLQVQALKGIPLPNLARLDVPLITSLVRQVMKGPDLATVLRIDAEVMRGYGLPARLERTLLRTLEGYERPGVPGFERYYPPGFESALPLHQALDLLVERNQGRRAIERIPVIDDPVMRDLFDEVDRDFGR